jgi:hypothetical protein
VFERVSREAREDNTDGNRDIRHESAPAAENSVNITEPFLIVAVWTERLATAQQPVPTI